MRNAGVVALLLLLTQALPAVASESEAAPRARLPRGAPAPARGPMERRDPVLRLGGARIDLEALRQTALEELKARMAEAVEARAEELRSAFDAETSALAQQIYKDFLYWLNERVRARLLRQYPHLKGEAALEEKYLEWLESPDQELSHYVELYMQERAPALKWLLDAYRDEASWEIAGGVQELFEDAQDRLQRFTRVVADAEREPNAPTAELLRRHGLSGDWIDHFEAQEDRFRTFDEGYRVLEATQVLVSAFQTRVPREKIDRLTDLLSLLGAAAEDSHVPAVSFFGQIVKAYGDVAREMLGQLDRLSKQLRQRAGYCVGTGATGDDRQRAFVRQFGSGDQACPTRMKDVYERTLPADGRIYFFVDGRFRAGREGQGEVPAVLKARALIRAAVAQGDSTWQGRENDLSALADVYDVAYSSAQFGRGLPGLLREAEETLAGIARRQRELEGGIASPCGLPALRRAVEQATGLRSGEGFEPVPGNEQRLAVRYAVGFIRGGGAHATYSRIWAALKGLSLLQVSGRVVARGGGACSACAGAALQVFPSGLAPLAGCEVSHADADGRFVLHALARSADFRLALSASQAGQRSDAVEVTRSVVGIERVPFVEAFSGVRLELPVAPTAVATPVPERGPEVAPRRTVSPGVDTSNPGGGPGPLPAIGGASPAPPRPRAPDPARVVPDLAGLAADAAQQRLSAAGLVALLVGGDPAPQAELAFKVQAQEPAAGAAVPPGARVTVRIHSAFDSRRSVPGVVGLPATEAEQRLRAAGFAVELAGGEAPSSRELEFRVQDQRPAAGEAVAAGSRVTVRVHSRFESRRAVPSVVGLPATEAEQRLRAAGFTPELAGGDPAPTRGAAFAVQSQEPAAPALLEPGGRVRVRVHSGFVEPPTAARPSPTPHVPPAAEGGGDRGVFVCPALGATAARSVQVTPGRSYALCHGYLHAGRQLGLVQVVWHPDGQAGAWPHGCGGPPDVRFQPAQDVTYTPADIRTGQPNDAPAKLRMPGGMLARFRGSRRQALVTLKWETGAEVPFPAELVELGQRLLAEAEWRGRPCGTAQPAAAPTPAPPPARPAVPSAPPAPADHRLPCACRDATGKPYRMTLDQECDPGSYLRSDDCRP